MIATIHFAISTSNTGQALRIATICRPNKENRFYNYVTHASANRLAELLNNECYPKQLFGDGWSVEYPLKSAEQE